MGIYYIPRGLVKLKSTGNALVGDGTMILGFFNATGYGATCAALPVLGATTNGTAIGAIIAILKGYKLTATA